MKNDDVQLIQRVLDGDDTAFSVLVRKYQRSVHALAWRKIGDFHIAEDITQDTFLKAHQRLSTLKKPQRFASWLYVIAANHCSTWLRKKRLWTQSLEETNSAQLEKATYSGYVIAENERITVETQREIVKKLLAKLQESERTVITLHYLGGMTYEEISEFLGVSVAAIKNRLYRARRRLKEEEPMIREALGNYQITPNLTENIMQEISRMKPIAPSGGKPMVPWAIGVSTLVVVLLTLGLGSQYLARFQKPYSFDAASEMTVELIEAPIVLDIESKPNVRTQLGNANTPSKSDTANQQPNDVSASVADAQSEEMDTDYSQWHLPKEAKARFGKGGINAMQFAPDGTQLAVGTDVGVWLYNIETGKEESLFRGMCHTLAFSPDGRFLANNNGASAEMSIQVWEIATEREEPLIDWDAAASVLRFSSDGKTLMGSWGSGIGRWNIENGREETKYLKTGLFGTGLFSSEDFSGVYAMTNDKIATGKKDGTIQLWDVTTRKKLSTLRGHVAKDSVLAVTFSPDGTRLASGSIDKTVRLWDLTADGESVTLQKHTGWINVLAFSPDGKMLASGSIDKTVQLWDTTTGEPRATLTGHLNGITALAFSPDGKTLASSSIDGIIRFWRTETGAPLADRITGHTQSMKAATFFADSSTLASVAVNRVITFWDAKTSQKSSIQAAGHGDWFPILAFSPDGTKLVSATSERVSLPEPSIFFGHLVSTWPILIHLMDVKTGRELATLQYGRGTNELVFSPDGKTVALGSIGEINLWNTETGDEQEILLVENDIRNIAPISALAFSPDGAILVSGTQHGDIQAWVVATGEAVPTFIKSTARENLGVISALALSQDFTLLAAGADSQLHLWDVSTGHKLFSVSTVHQRGKRVFHGPPEPLVFSPDGTILVNGHNSGTIQLWDVKTGDKIAALDEHTQKVETLKFSPDEATLISTAQDGTILLWDWDEILVGSSKSE